MTVASGGPVPWTIVITVDDLDAKEADLALRHTTFSRTVDDITGAEALAAERSATLNVPFLFVMDRG